MNEKRSWTIKQLKDAVGKSTSYRQVIYKLNLVPAGGNYIQVQKYTKENNLNTKHFKGHAWNKGLKGIGIHRVSLRDILRKGTYFPSYKLKKRLFNTGLKEKKCKKCGWAKKTEDGYLPLELDHINGDRYDNRLKNLRILCPNCHSLTSHHRGRKRYKYRASGGTGRRATLKML